MRRAAGAVAWPWRDRERGRAALFAPVALGFGVWLYFALDVEPPAQLGETLLLLAGALFLARLAAVRLWLRLSAAGLALVALGFGLTQIRAQERAAPVWAEAARAPVTLSGRVIALSQRADGRARILIDQVQAPNWASDQTPERVRVSVADGADVAPLAIGDRIRVAARLRPPPGPVEPGAYDFRLRAWFQQLGALAFPVGPIERLGPTSPSAWFDRAALWLAQERARLSAHLRAASPGIEGAVMAAVLVGDRSGLDEATLEALRASNLAHLLAISGLHMGLVCLTVFGALRAPFALLADRAWPIAPKKVAAIGALIAGAAYLALSGAAIPTQRAYVMALVMFGAMLADRPAITLRAVALAAMILLIWRPESLLEAGFQLSFAATTAVVAAFEACRPLLRRAREHRERRSSARRLRAWAVAFFAALALSSIAAGLATAPFAAHVFSRAAPYGLPANLAAVPAMGLVIMPMGVAAALLAPFGLDGLATSVMASGVAYVLSVAHIVAAWPGSVRPIAAGSTAAIAVIALGGLWLCLWRGLALRALGLAPILVGLALWRAEPRPDLLIAPGGRLFGVLTEEGRALDWLRRGRYAAEIWLRRDGDLATPETAVERPGFVRTRGRLQARLRGDWRLDVFFGRNHSREAVAAACRPRVVVATPQLNHPPPPEAPCLFLRAAALAEAGAVALWIEPNGAVRLERTSTATGRRLWTEPPLVAAPDLEPQTAAPSQ